ncbi:MAG: MFS transporter, partial [Betaproteobacteria bacterium]|nr:MFS transporter [Betaproteobacteria bacterium]
MTQPDTAFAASIEAATRRAIALLSLATFSSMVSQRICDPMLPALSREFGVPLAVAAQVVSMFAVVYGISQLFYGPMGDRLGKFRVVTWATLGCGVASVGAVLAPTLDALVLARMGVALGAGAIIPLALAWTGDAVPYARRQETLARLGL